MRENKKITGEKVYYSSPALIYGVPVICIAIVVILILVILYLFYKTDKYYLYLVSGRIW